MQLRLLRMLKPCSRRVRDSRWWGSLTMVPTGNKAERHSSVNHTTKTIHQFNSSRINNWTIFYLTWFDLILSFYFLTSRFFYKSIIKIYVNNSCCFVSDIGLCRKKNVDLHESRSWSLWITGKNTKVDIVDLGSFIKRQTSGRYIEWQRVVQWVKTNDNQL